MIQAYPFHVNYNVCVLEKLLMVNR